MCKFQII